MGKGLATALAFLVIIVVFGSLITLEILSYYNEAVQLETLIKAQYDQNKNNYTKMFNSFVESSQIPKMYIDGLKEVYDSALKGRYGKDGSKAIFNWIREQNPQVDSKVYTKIQTLIEVNRNEFESNQKSLVDKKQIYEAYLRQQPRGMFLSILGFPKIDLNTFAIVTSDQTEKVFEEKKAGPIILSQ